MNKVPAWLWQRVEVIRRRLEREKEARSQPWAHLWIFFREEKELIVDCRSHANRDSLPRDIKNVVFLSQLMGLDVQYLMETPLPPPTKENR